jgi:hypothetical protein
MIKSNTKEIHMSGNLTDKLPNNNDSLTSVIRVVKDLTTKVEALNEKVELRLYDTRPMWEQVLKTVLELKEGQQRLEQGHERLEQGHERVEQGQIILRQEFEHLGRGQESLRRESHEIKTFCRDILRRL